jgi:hypothetical protein
VDDATEDPEMNSAIAVAGSISPQRGKRGDPASFVRTGFVGCA